ncbi:MAG: ABC transporter transmembrane domain-containing protein [Elusimicrobiota bacterium]
MPESAKGKAVEARVAATAPFLFFPREEAMRLLRKAKTSRLRQGDFLARKGEFPREVFIPLDGGLRETSDAEGAGESLPLFEPVGLYGLLKNESLSSTIMAWDEAMVLTLPWKELKTLIEGVRGLAAHLRLVAESAAARELDRTLEDVGCAPAFRCALIGSLNAQQAPPGSWLANEGETPDFILYGVLGTIRAYERVAKAELDRLDALHPQDALELKAALEPLKEALEPLWIAPNLTWQFLESCLGEQPLRHGFKALTEVEYFKVERETLLSLRRQFPNDFEAFAGFSLRAQVRPPETRVAETVERLEDLFPPPPRPVQGDRLRYPFVRQGDEMECGAACLAMISKFYGNDLPLKFWWHRMNIGQEGASLFDMGKAAEKVGFVSHGLQVDDLSGVEPSLFPLVALRAGHFLVVYRAQRASVLVGDPAIGVSTMTTEEFKKGFRGFVLMLKPTEQFYLESAPLTSYRHYTEMLRGHGAELGLIAALSLTLTALSTIPAFLSQFIIDEVLAKKDLDLLALGLLVVVGVTGMIGLMNWLRSYYVGFLNSRLGFASTSAFMRRLFSLPYDFFARRHVGDFTRRLAELETVRQFLTSELIGTALDFLNLFGYGIVLFYYSPQVAFAVYLSAPVFVLLSILYSGRMANLYNEGFRARTEQDSLLADQIKGVATLKTLGAEVAARWRFEESLVRTLQVRYRSRIAASSLGGVSSFLGGMISTGVLGLAAYMAVKGQMTPGQVMAVSMLAAGVVAPFKSLAGLWSQIQELRVVLDRLNDIFLAEPEIRPDRRSLIKSRLRGEIEFRDVWFRYGGESSDWVIKGMSFHIMPGQDVAVVGPSGAGKSTVAVLTARLYEPTRGTILIDGRDYREYDRQWLRRQMGFMLQETTLFHGTLLENIAYGDPRPDINRVQRAVELAGAADFIYDKGDKFDYMITHGGLGLSGGQKQRIGIARLLYTEPVILFLDEATSFVDLKAERTLAHNLKGAFKGRTQITIAHRPHTVRFADFVMVVDGGKVVEFGTHAELVRKRGVFSELFAEEPPS